jgi:hypothetical protein
MSKLDTTTFKQFDKIVKEREGSLDNYRRRINAWKRRWGYLDPKMYDPLTTEFAENLLNRTKNRWAHDRSAALDQITGNVYSEVRTKELGSISGGHYLSLQYGMRTAINRGDLSIQPGLRVNNPNSAIYNRDFPSDKMPEQCMKLYKDKTGNKPSGSVCFVNSQAAVERYQFFYPDDKIKSVTVLGHGVVAVEPENSSSKMKDRMKHLGGMPSSFEVMKRAEGGDQEAPLAEKPLGNAAKLDGITGKENKAVAALDALPEDHAMKQVATSAVSLLKGLQKALANVKDSEKFEKNPLIDNSLRALETVVKALPTMAQDSARFFGTYEAMLDEVYIILAAAKPYDAEAFKKAAGTSLKQRAPVLKGFNEDVEQSSYLVSSGMDAITTGWQAAAMLAGGSKQAASLAGRGERDPDYFEVGEIISDTKLGDSGGVLTATLNPSLPRTTKAEDKANAWDADVLIEKVQEKLTQQEKGKPLVLLLDVTIEKESAEDGSSELNRVLKAFKAPIEEGTLKLVLAKSYQKYPSLGSGKVMAGSVTILAKSDDATADAAKNLQGAEEKLDWMANDESQLLTHFLTEGAGSEVPMIAKAAESAKFAQQFCTGGKGWDNYQEGLPFVLVGDMGPYLKCAKLKKQNYTEVGKLVQSSGSDLKDSFAFLGTSYLNGVPTEKGGGCRITLGQESREEVVEKLWGIGTIVCGRSPKPPLEPKEILDHSKKAIDNACDDVGKNADLACWSATAIRIIEQTGEDVGGLRTQLSEVEKARANGEPDSDKENALRLALTNALSRSEGKSANPLKDKLDLVACAFPPVIPEEVRKGNDPDAMRASLERKWQGPGTAGDETRFAPNIVASCLNLLAGAFGPELADDEDCAKIEALYEAAIGSGLNGVSPGACTKLINGWARLQQAKLKDPTTQKAALADTARNAQLLPYREDKAKLLADCVPDEAMELAEPAERGPLIKALFGPLDLDARALFINALILKQDYHKAQACLEALRADLEAARDRKVELVQPERLTGTPSTEGTGPAPMDADEINERLEELGFLETKLLSSMGTEASFAAALAPAKGGFNGLGRRMGRWAPQICHGATPEAATLTRVAVRIEQMMAMIPGATKEALAGFPRELMGFGPELEKVPPFGRKVMSQLLQVLVNAFHERQKQLGGK